MSSLAPAPAPRDWQALETWVDPSASPPYSLMLLMDAVGCWQVVDPAQDYRTLFSTSSYDEAKEWVLEDEYESVRGRLLAIEDDRGGGKADGG